MESEGYYLSLTKGRFGAIEKRFKESHLKIGDRTFSLRDFRIKMLKSSVKIYSELFNEITKEIEATQIS